MRSFAALLWDSGLLSLLIGLGGAYAILCGLAALVLRPIATTDKSGRSARLGSSQPTRVVRRGVHSDPCCGQANPALADRNDPDLCPELLWVSRPAPRSGADHRPL